MISYQALVVIKVVIEILTMKVVKMLFSCRTMVFYHFVLSSSYLGFALWNLWELLGTSGSFCEDLGASAGLLGASGNLWEFLGWEP